MKFLFTTDWHVDASTAGIERLPELGGYVATLEEIVSDEEEKIDLVLHLGDCWDPGSIHDSRWGRFVYDAFHRLSCATTAEEGERPGLIAIPGNHDVIDSAIPTSTLSPLAATRVRDVLVLEEPRLVMIRTEHEQAVVVGLPYVSRAFERTDRYRRALDNVIAEAACWASRAPVIVIGHLAFEGMTPGSESEEMARGREVRFPVELVAQVAPALIVNGHYHQRQTIVRDGLKIEIPGAPIRFTFGERDDGDRGYLIAEMDGRI